MRAANQFAASSSFIDFFTQRLPMYALTVTLTPMAIVARPAFT
jgi:hypothetical protein